MVSREVAFVTGAAQGIGWATAQRLALDGFRVVAMDRSEALLRACASDACKKGLGLGKNWTFACASACD